MITQSVPNVDHSSVNYLLGISLKTTAPFERLNSDFKGSPASAPRNRYLMTIVDEYSRFPLAYARLDSSAEIGIRGLTNLLSIFSMPSYVHSDRASTFMSEELKKLYLE